MSPFLGTRVEPKSINSAFAQAAVVRKKKYIDNFNVYFNRS